MKKSILAVFYVTVLGLMLACNSSNKSSNDLVGKWEKANSQDVRLVLEISSDNLWYYFKNDTLLEKGMLEIEDDKFIMKHAVEEHSHADGGSHEHEAPEDHKYKYSLNEEKNELSIISHEKTTIYKKLK